MISKIIEWVTGIRSGKDRPEHLRRGEIGEAAARKHLSKSGMKFLTANFKTKRGEIDLIFRDSDCLVFVEVKTRSDETWTRPAAAVNQRKKRLLSLTAMDYLKRLRGAKPAVRFDIVEVLIDDEKVNEVRHIANAFPLVAPFRIH